MKTKICAAFLLICVVLSLFSSCGKNNTSKKDDDEHSHRYSSWQVESLPTCTQRGEEIRSCDCGKVQSRSIDMVAHSYTWAVTKPATETEPGEEKGTCVCGRFKVREIPIGGTGSGGADTNSPSTGDGSGDDTEPAGCKHDYKYSVTREPTCVVNGYARNICRICGYNEWVEIPAHANHHYGNDDLCDECGTYRGGNPEIEPAGCTHAFRLIVVDISCTESYARRVCALCGYIDEVDEIPGLGHSIVEEPATAPTCTSPGYGRSICETCGFVAELREIPALGHYFVNNKCKVCGVFRGEAEETDKPSGGENKPQEPLDTTGNEYFPDWGAEVTTE